MFTRCTRGPPPRLCLQRHARRRAVCNAVDLCPVWSADRPLDTRGCPAYRFVVCYAAQPRAGVPPMLLHSVCSVDFQSFSDTIKFGTFFVCVCGAWDATYGYRQWTGRAPCCISPSRSKYVLSDATAACRRLRKGVARRLQNTRAATACA